MIGVMEDYLVDYNGMSKRPMNLAMFLFAVEHVSRICRILTQPGGHLLLVGVGGSGRQSLTRLGASINGMEVIQVEISKSYTTVEWRDDLKRILRTSGAEGKPTVFLFSDTQIKDEAFVEDINNILNAGEVRARCALEASGKVGVDLACTLVKELIREFRSEFLCCRAFFSSRAVDKGEAL